MLLFHGITGSPDELSPLRTHLRNLGCEVTTPLLEGHDTSIEEMRQVPLERWIAAAEAAYAELRESSGGRLSEPPIFVGGLSFGAFLALHCATLESVAPPTGCFLLSPPFRLRRPGDELILNALSHLPDSLLNRLPLVEKTARDTSKFTAPRKSYSHHAVGTVAKILRLRRSLRQRAVSLTCPVLTVFDPNDHHLARTAGDIALMAFPHSALSMHRWLPGGEHELTIGPRAEAVQQIVEEFMLRAQERRQPDISHAP